MIADQTLQRRAGVPQGLTIVIAAFLPIMAIVSLFPAVPSIIDHFHADPGAMWKVPWMVTAPGLAIALLAPFAGVLVDRFGRRKLVLWTTFFYGALGAAPFFLENLNLIFLSRILLGVSEAAILTIMNTLIGDYWDDAGRRRWLAIQGFVGPIFGSALILTSGYLTKVHWSGTFLIYLVAFPVFLAMYLFLFEPTNDETARRMLGMDETDTSIAFPLKTFIGIAALTLLCSIAYYVYPVNGGLAFQEVGVRTPDRLGEITFIPGLVVMVGAGLFWLMGRVAYRLQIGLMLALLGSGMAMIGFAPTWQWMVFGLCFQQTGAGMTIAVLIAYAQRHLPFEHRGRGMGLWAAAFFLGQFASPPIVAVVHGRLGTMQTTFVAFGLAALAGAIVAFIAELLSRKPASSINTLRA